MCFVIAHIISRNSLLGSLGIFHHSISSSLPFSNLVLLNQSGLVGTFSRVIGKKEIWDEIFQLAFHGLFRNVSQLRKIVDVFWIILLHRSEFSEVKSVESREDQLEFFQLLLIIGSQNLHVDIRGSEYFSSSRDSFLHHVSFSEVEGDSMISILIMKTKLRFFLHRL